MLDLTGDDQGHPKPVTPIQGTDEPTHLPDILAGVLVGIVALAALGIFFVNRANTTTLHQLDAEYDALTAEIQTGNLGKAATEIVRVSNTIGILKGQKKAAISSDYLTAIQATTPVGIKLETLAIDEHQTLRVEGRADDYPGLAGFVATLRGSPLFHDVNLLSASTTNNGTGGQAVAFALSLTIKPAATPVTGGTQ